MRFRVVTRVAVVSDAQFVPDARFEEAKAFIRSGVFGAYDYEPLLDSLEGNEGFGRGDYFLVGKDFPAYVDAQVKVDTAYRNQEVRHSRREGGRGGRHRSGTEFIPPYSFLFRISGHSALGALLSAASDSVSACHVSVPRHHATSSCHVIMPRQHATSSCHAIMPRQHATYSLCIYRIVHSASPHTVHPFTRLVISAMDQILHHQHGNFREIQQRPNHPPVRHRDLGYQSQPRAVNRQ